MRDQFGIQLHTALACLEHAPTADAFDSLAEVFNVIQIDLEDDARRTEEAVVIGRGAAALNAVMAGVRLSERPGPEEIARIRTGVNVIDGLMGRLDVTRLYLAMQKLKAMKKLAAQEAA